MVTQPVHLADVTISILVLVHLTRCLLEEFRRRNRGFSQTKKGLHRRVEQGLSWDNGRELLVGDLLFEACWSCVRQRLVNFERLNWTVTKAGGA